MGGCLSLAIADTTVEREGASRVIRGVGRGRWSRGRVIIMATDGRKDNTRVLLGKVVKRQHQTTPSVYS